VGLLVSFSDVNYEELASNETALGEFQADVITGLAVAANVTEKQVELLDIRMGSVVVDAMIRFPANDQEEVKKAATLQEKAVMAPASIFEASPNLQVYGEITVTLPPPPPPLPPPSPAPPPPPSPPLPPPSPPPPLPSPPPKPQDILLLTKEGAAAPRTAVPLVTLVAALVAALLAIAL
jgi:hypothetical protein